MNILKMKYRQIYPDQQYVWETEPWIGRMEIIQSQLLLEYGQVNITISELLIPGGSERGDGGGTPEIEDLSIKGELGKYRIADLDLPDFRYVRKDISRT